MVFVFLTEDEDDGKTELGIAELVALTAGPVIFICVIFVTVFLLYHRHQQKNRPLSQLVEPNPIDTPLLPDGQPSTLTELMFDYSGSGSGKKFFTSYLPLRRKTKIAPNNTFLIYLLKKIRPDVSGNVYSMVSFV